MHSTNARARVVHLGPAPEGSGGMAAVLRALMASPLAEDHELDVITTWRSPRPVDRVVVFGRALVALIRWCLGRGDRIVHLHTTVRGSLHRKSILLFVAKALRRPVILHVHSGPGDIETFHQRLGRVRLRLFKAALARADLVMAVSRATAEEVERRFDRRGILVVPNAVPPCPDSSPGGNGDSAAVTYVGGFANPVKGGDMLVAALPEVLRACPEASFSIAGPGDPPAGTKEIVSSNGHVRWLGWLEPGAAGELLANTSVFVLPSLSEGLPVALLEAMSCGCAIVATKVGGVPDTLRDGEDALLVPAGDSDALAEALSKLLADRDLRIRLGRAALARADELNRDEVWGRLSTVYSELVAR